VSELTSNDAQSYREGFQAMMEPPGSYCAYASLYITMCLIKIFSLATETFEEQHRWGMLCDVVMIMVIMVVVVVVMMMVI